MRLAVPLLAERTEKLRVDWAQDRMVELGKARAQALGWPDAYAYSKALGEWALLEGRGALPGDGGTALHPRGRPFRTASGLDQRLPVWPSR